MPLKQPEPIKFTETGVPFEMINASEQQPFVRMGVVGPSGVGKTTLAASAAEEPEMSPVLVIDCGESSDTILGEQRFQNVQVIRVRSMEEMQSVFQWLAPSERFAGGGDGYKDFRTIVIDESDELHLSAMRPLMREAHEKKNQDLHVASEREWGKVRNMMLDVVDWFRTLPVHLIFTYVPYLKKDAITGAEKVTIGLAGKLSDDLGKRFSLVVYLDIVEEAKLVGGKRQVKQTRKLIFNATSRVLTKVRGESRAARFGDEMLDPTMSKVYKAYFGVE